MLRAKNDVNYKGSRSVSTRTQPGDVAQIATAMPGGLIYRLLHPRVLRKLGSLDRSLFISTNKMQQLCKT